MQTDKLKFKKNIIGIVSLVFLSGVSLAFAQDQDGATNVASPADAGSLQPQVASSNANSSPTPAQVSAAPPAPLSQSMPTTTVRSETSRSEMDSDTPAVQMSPLSYSESQAAMLSTVPQNEAPNAEASAAFNALMKQNMPLTPQQVVKLRQLIDMSQRAAATPPTVPPKPVSTTIVMNLAPGTTPPAIRLARGYVSSLVFVDSTGAPWPIAAYDIGDPKIANIQWDGKSNVLLIQAANAYGNGNIVLRLAGLMTPLTLELVSGQRVVDYRTDIHVSGIGPNAKDIAAGNGLPASANQLLLSVLDGIAPPGSKALTVKGGDCQAWLLGDKMYLRTRFALLSPGWVGKMVSPDGMNAYEVQKSSAVLISQYGEPVELKIEGF